MTARQPNWGIRAVLLMLAGMILMTGARFEMESSRALYVVLLTSAIMCGIGSVFCLSRNK